MSLRESDQVFMLFVSLRGITERMIMNLSVVCEFSEVFPDDTSDFPPGCKVKFVIDLVPGIILVSMSPYRMYASKLCELKKQLEDLLENKFVRPSVSL